MYRKQGWGENIEEQMQRHRCREEREAGRGNECRSVRGLGGCSEDLAQFWWVSCGTVLLYCAVKRRAEDALRVVTLPVQSSYCTLMNQTNHMNREKKKKKTRSRHGASWGGADSVR